MHETTLCTLIIHPNFMVLNSMAMWFLATGLLLQKMELKKANSLTSTIFLELKKIQDHHKNGYFVHPGVTF